MKYKACPIMHWGAGGGWLGFIYSAPWVQLFSAQWKPLIYALLPHGDWNVASWDKQALPVISAASVLPAGGQVTLGLNWPNNLSG